MPEIIVKYKSQRTLEALMDFAKYFDFKIVAKKPTEKKINQNTLNGITIIPADSSVNTSELTDIFTGKGIRAAKLRNDGWQRRK